MKRLLPLFGLLAVGFAVERDPGGEGEERSRTHVVEMRNFEFSPRRLELSVGDTVVWVNRDVAPHTVADSSGRWRSGDVASAGRWSHIVAAPGRDSYACDYHPSMGGELIIRGPRLSGRQAAGRSDGHSINISGLLPTGDHAWLPGCPVSLWQRASLRRGCASPQAPADIP